MNMLSLLGVPLSKQLCGINGAHLKDEFGVNFKSRIHFCILVRTFDNNWQPRNVYVYLHPTSPANISCTLEPACD